MSKEYNDSQIIIMTRKELMEFADYIVEQINRNSIQLPTPQKSKKEDADFYTRKELADKLHVCERTIDKMRKNGVFGDRSKKGIDRIGSRVLIEKKAVDAYMSSPAL